MIIIGDEMKEKINFGIGFITGRPNICSIINNYYEYIVNQVKDLQMQVNFTFFILYDLNYLDTKEEEYYNILPEVHKHIQIKYLSPKYVLEKRKKVMDKHNITEDEVDLLIGKGYARARNTILYEALEQKIDYLLFWDDDEYPLAALKDGESIKWIKQDNILQHIKNIENVDVTYGYRCGMINPLPIMQFNDIITENVYKDFIEAIENEVISWDKVQAMAKNELGIGYADEQVAFHNKDAEKIEKIGKDNFVLGSGICLNLKHIDKIPAFYNPPEARGEDTFFSCALGNLNATVLRIPVYHFHDAYLKFTFLMKDKFPKKLKKITIGDNGISLRFQRTIIGWIKYKPLLCYIKLDSNDYKEKMKQSKLKLKNNVDKMCKAFDDCDLTCLPEILEKYDNNVKQHYEEYLKVNNIWNKIKKDI